MNAAWLRVMALLYDPFLWLGEVAGMRRHRRALLAGVSGRVLEIGAGTGLNLPRYPPNVGELIVAEPEPGMRNTLFRRVTHSHRGVRVVDAPAEALPLADDSVDTVVCTLVLCTVAEPERALREIKRVLRPGGRLLFIEHVRAQSRWLAACQSLLARPWRVFAGGCDCTRDTMAVMTACGFSPEVEHANWRGMPAIVHPLLIGSARHTET
ncbi:class I SAM-dependent methyltransferase [Mycolicibacterium sp. 018/SC-01/001]|uniref:class I SAM-dependent methyltransferase n=1 Tax=Mycolicibacterium sp. 018/SC-01/001 TaxID=2592069 RepID=UPI001180CA49|nr:class I SAM-dependent methyltransferase [Mycolicibacterium sp. 018/SC-01/001]TRW89073.1 class I SAM-dependent methyltransferase [Mycolicibacterium sp. 018/SC-01/001]